MFNTIKHNFKATWRKYIDLDPLGFKPGNHGLSSFAAIVGILYYPVGLVCLPFIAIGKTCYDYAKGNTYPDMSRSSFNYVDSSVIYPVSTSSESILRRTGYSQTTFASDPQIPTATNKDVVVSYQPEMAVTPARPLSIKM